MGESERHDRFDHGYVVALNDVLAVGSVRGVLSTKQGVRVLPELLAWLEGHGTDPATVPFLVGEYGGEVE